MSDQPQGLGPSTDISAADLDVEANDEVTETGNPDAYDGDETLGGSGGADTTGGGAG